MRNWLAQHDVRIINLDLLTYAGNLDSLGQALDHPRHQFVQGDIGDSSAILSLLLAQRPCAIVNLAAESHVDRSIDGPAAFVQTNVLGLFRLLEAVRQYWLGLEGTARRDFRFLQVSTDEVYGSLGAEGKFNESTPYSPNSPYSASKAAGDHFVRAYQHTYGLPTLVTHCSNNYGPFQFPEKLIPLMILNAASGKPLPVYGNGQQIRDWLHVEDHCQALWQVLNQGRPGETYDIGGNSELTNLEVVQRICDLVDELRPDLAERPRRRLITFVVDRPGHDTRYAIDCSKICAELQWAPRRSFPEGLRDTVKWYLSNGNWLERISAGNYRQERLGVLRKAS